MDLTQQMAAIPGFHLAPIESLVSQLVSSVNDQRSAADSLFHSSRDLHPDRLTLNIANLLPSSPAPRSAPYPLSSAAAPSPRYPILLSAIQREDTKSGTRKLCDTLSEVTAALLLDSAWAELLPFMFHAVAAPDSLPLLHESALLIFMFHALTAAFLDIGETLLPILQAVLLAALPHPTSADVHVAALSAFVNLVQFLPSAAAYEISESPASHDADPY